MNGLSPAGLQAIIWNGYFSLIAFKTFDYFIQKPSENSRSQAGVRSAANNMLCTYLSEMYPSNCE